MAVPTEFIDRDIEGAVKARVANAVQKTGITKKLKSELRYQLIESLQRMGSTLPSGVVGHGESGNASSGKSLTLADKAIFSLILDFLQHKEKHYSFSVLLPECGMAAADVLSPEEVGQALSLIDVPLFAGCLSPASRGSPLLLRLVTALSALRKPMHSTQSTQTDGGGIGQSLDAKLQACMTPTAETLARDRRTIEERMLEFQTRCEVRCRRESEAEIARVRKLERERVALEEAAKSRAEFQEAVLKAERDAQDREQQMQARERAALERLHAKELELEKKAVEWRASAQRALDEGMLRQRTRSRQLEVDEQRMSLKEQALERRERELAMAEGRFQDKQATGKADLQIQMQAFKSEVESNVAEDRSSIHRKELALEREAMQLERDRGRLKDLEEKLSATERSASEARTAAGHAEDRLTVQRAELEDCRRQLSLLTEADHKGQASADRLRLELSTLQHELESARTQASILQETDQVKQQSAAKAQALLSAHAESLQQENNRLQPELEHLRSRLHSCRSEQQEAEARIRATLEGAWQVERVSLQSEVERLRRHQEDAVTGDLRLHEELRRVKEDNRVARRDCEELTMRLAGQAEEVLRLKKVLEAMGPSSVSGQQAGELLAMAQQLEEELLRGCDEGDVRHSEEMKRRVRGFRQSPAQVELEEETRILGREISAFASRQTLPLSDVRAALRSEWADQAMQDFCRARGRRDEPRRASASTCVLVSAVEGRGDEHQPGTGPPSLEREEVTGFEGQYRSTPLYTTTRPSSQHAAVTSPQTSKKQGGDSAVPVLSQGHVAQVTSSASSEQAERMHEYPGEVAQPLQSASQPRGLLKGAASADGAELPQPDYSIRGSASHARAGAIPSASSLPPMAGDARPGAREGASMSVEEQQHRDSACPSSSADGAAMKTLEVEHAGDDIVADRSGGHAAHMPVAATPAPADSKRRSLDDMFQDLSGDEQRPPSPPQQQQPQVTKTTTRGPEVRPLDAMFRDDSDEELPLPSEKLTATAPKELDAMFQDDSTDEALRKAPAALPATQPEKRPLASMFQDDSIEEQSLSQAVLPATQPEKRPLAGMFQDDSIEQQSLTQEPSAPATSATVRQAERGLDDMFRDDPSSPVSDMRPSPGTSHGAHDQGQTEALAYKTPSSSDAVVHVAKAVVPEEGSEEADSDMVEPFVKSFAADRSSMPSSMDASRDEAEERPSRVSPIKTSHVPQSGDSLSSKSPESAAEPAPPTRDVPSSGSRRSSSQSGASIPSLPMDAYNESTAKSPPSLPAAQGGLARGANDSVESVGSAKSGGFIPTNIAEGSVGSAQSEGESAKSGGFIPSLALPASRSATPSSHVSGAPGSPRSDSAVEKLGTRGVGGSSRGGSEGSGGLQQTQAASGAARPEGAAGGTANVVQPWQARSPAGANESEDEASERLSGVESFRESSRDSDPWG